MARSEPFALPDEKDKVDVLERFEQASSKPLWGAVIAGLVLLFNSCANLMVIQQLRAALKVAEIGMLKAMGMGAALPGLAQPLFGVFGQQIAQRDAAAPGLGRKSLGKVTGQDDGAVDAIVALPAWVAQFRQALSLPRPASQRL